jgi:hypothetical protein
MFSNYYNALILGKNYLSLILFIHYKIHSIINSPQSNSLLDKANSELLRKIQLKTITKG